jgi:hypothetical protein
MASRSARLIACAIVAVVVAAVILVFLNAMGLF